jgi:gamma-carbonic anhydrase
MTGDEGGVPQVHATAYVDADAHIIGDVELGLEASTWGRAVLRAEFGPIRIGSGSCILEGVVIESGGGTRIGRDCVIGPSAKLTGAQLEDATFVGAGAIVGEGCRVKTGGMVAPGAVLAAHLIVPAGFRAEGNPAELISIPNAADAVRKQALKYREVAARYRLARMSR